MLLCTIECFIVMFAIGHWFVCYGVMVGKNGLTGHHQRPSFSIVFMAKNSWNPSDWWS